MLDFQSVTRFSRISVQGANIMQSFPAYQDLMKHAPDALAALSQTKLLGLHSASQLLTTLRTEGCATCSEYGIYLLLPTCERYCWQCLQCNPTRRVITRTAAGRIFALSPKTIQQLPVMYSIPGRYGVARKSSHVSYKLVSVSAAKELAISIYGSAENVTTVTVRSRRQAAHTTRFLQAAFLDCKRLYPLMMPDQGSIGNDRYFGMASIPFPSLTIPDTAEQGLWCKGCEWVYLKYKEHQVPTHVVAKVVPANCRPNRVLYGMTRRARSTFGLLEHIRHCHGAQQLVASEDSGYN